MTENLDGFSVVSKILNQPFSPSGHSHRLVCCPATKFRLRACSSTFYAEYISLGVPCLTMYYVQNELVFILSATQLPRGINPFMKKREKACQIRGHTHTHLQKTVSQLLQTFCIMFYCQCQPQLPEEGFKNKQSTSLAQR